MTQISSVRDKEHHTTAQGHTKYSEFSFKHVNFKQPATEGVSVEGNTCTSSSNSWALKRK